MIAICEGRIDWLTEKSQHILSKKKKKKQPYATNAEIYVVGLVDFAGFGSGKCELLSLNIPESSRSSPVGHPEQIRASTEGCGDN